jgi:hypothetical protein
MSFIQIWSFFQRNPPLNFHHLKIFIVFILDNITFYSSHLEKNKIRIMRFNEHNISNIKIFKWCVNN